MEEEPGGVDSVGGTGRLTLDRIGTRGASSYIVIVDAR